MAFLPVYVGGAADWMLHDWRQVFLTSQPAADGVALVQTVQVPQDELWLVERIVVQCDSATKTEARLYLDALDDSRCLDGSRSGNFDVADQASPMQIPGASTLLCQWTGASAGAVAQLRAQVAIMRRSDGS